MRFEDKSKAQKEKFSAQCKLCNRVLSATLHVSSNFLRHLRLRHKEEFKEYQILKKEAKSSESKQSHFDRLVLGFVGSNVLPVSVVESNSFKRLIKFCSPNLRVMSRPSMMKLIDSTFNELKQNFISVIRKGTFFCATANIWSTKHRSFFGYTCHWLYNDFERKSISLACKRFSGTHSFDAISRMIHIIHEEYGLNTNNLIATTTDNASNFVKAFREFGVVNHGNFLDKDEDEYALDNDLTELANRHIEATLSSHIRCASHTLNLIATTDFNRLLKTKSLIYEKHRQVSQTKKKTNL